MQTVIEEFKKQLKNAIRAFREEIIGVRSSRPSTALLENLNVSYYGQTMPIKHIASISVAPPRDIFIQAWDKEAVPAIAKAIESSSLGLTPQTEGTSIRVRLPELSQERRDELARHIKKIAEQSRIQIRHLRDEANKEIQSMFDDGECNEDQKFKLKEGAQKETEGANKEIDDILKSKINEINE